MTLLVFIGLSLLAFGRVSTGPHDWLEFGWLELHRDGESWSVEVHITGLLAMVFLAVLLTWILSVNLAKRSSRK